MRLNGG